MRHIKTDFKSCLISLAFISIQFCISLWNSSILSRPFLIRPNCSQEKKIRVRDIQWHLLLQSHVNIKIFLWFIYFLFVLKTDDTEIDPKILKYCVYNTEKGLSGLAALRWWRVVVGEGSGHITNIPSPFFPSFFIAFLTNCWYCCIFCRLGNCHHEHP